MSKTKKLPGTEIKKLSKSERKAYYKALYNSKPNPKRAAKIKKIELLMDVLEQTSSEDLKKISKEGREPASGMARHVLRERTYAAKKNLQKTPTFPRMQTNSPLGS